MIKIRFSKDWLLDEFMKMNQSWKMPLLNKTKNYSLAKILANEILKFVLRWFHLLSINL